jgi:lipopolysaccharide transport system ATP-binding protein
MKPIIEVNNLYKKYTFGLKQPNYSLRDNIVNTTKKLPSLLSQKKINGKLEKNQFWALKNISFKVKSGEVVGIIGRNGAGKSTLLKLLSRITSPTKGEITLRGKVASLLEVGTGFHSELTGKENIYLNGAILGMKRAEINDKFDEIVEFAEIPKFLDTPVKHYSSGMYMRLAFAIAAHLDPEILLVDEVLAVGDAEFQKKCLGKMGEVAKAGRTILFVSHNMNAISRLCNKAIFIKNGSIEFYGKVSEAISLYSDPSLNNIGFSASKKLHKKAFVKNFKVLINQNKSNIASNQLFTFVVDIQAQQHLSKLEVGIGINDELGHRITTLFSRFYNVKFQVKPGIKSVFCRVKNLILKPGVYYVNIFVGDRYEAYDFILDPIMFKIETDDNFFPSRMIPDESQGSVLVSQEWSIESESKVV